MKKIFVLLAAALLLFGCKAAADLSAVPEATLSEVSRVEPLSWWTGMKTPLQLMVQGPGISGYDVRIEGGSGVSVLGVKKADSPDYVFVDVNIRPGATAGTYYLVFSDGKRIFKVPYLLRERREGSAERKSFKR